MNRTLESCISDLRGLDEADQARFGSVISEMLAEVRSGADFTMALWDPEFREYVERSVSAGIADLESGSVFSASEIRARSAARLNKRDG